MTQNQINYKRYQEEARHNLAQETEQQRSNKKNEFLGSLGLTETQRHNMEQESINWWANREQKRHNQQVEQTGIYSAQSLAGLQAAQAALSYSNVGVQREANAIGWMNAGTQSTMVQNQSQYWTDTTNINRTNAMNNYANSQTNERNAGTNAYNAQSTRTHYINQDNASAINANANKRNAQTNYDNTTVNMVRAASDVFRAVTGR